MSTQPALHLSTDALAAYPRAATQKKESISGLTLNGLVLFITCLLVVASGYLNLRPQIMGLALHPYLVPMVLALPLVFLARINLFPVRVLVSLLVFWFMYCFSVLSGEGLPMGEIFKISSGVLTIITVALLVRRRGDFVAGALGLSIAIALLAARGLQDAPGGGVDPMEGANKNSYSLFALPAILVAGFISSRMTSVPIVTRGLLAASALPALAAIFMSANRSGYLGAALIGLLLFWDRRGRGMFMVAAAAGAIMLWMSSYGNTTVFDERMRQTVEGTHSDDLRVAIITSCAWIALENPIIGVSPSGLPWEIGRRTNVGHVHLMSRLDSHNVFGHVAAGSGLICLAALLAVGFTLWNLRSADGQPLTSNDKDARQALTLMRMMILLWVVRGMFTREILYNPACAIGIGLCLGLFIVARGALPARDAADVKSSSAKSGRGLPALPTS
jgi:hypothetical protein